MHVLACQVDAPGNSYQLGRLLHDRGIPGFSRTFPWPGRGLGPRGPRGPDLGARAPGGCLEGLPLPGRIFRGLPPRT